jgi:hypothetical protein
MNFNYIAVFGGIALICLSACSGPGRIEETRVKNFEMIAIENLGGEVSAEYNQTKNFALYIHKDKANSGNPLPLLKFMLIDVRTGKVLCEESVPAGSVKWLNNTQIEVKWVPGNVSIENSGKVPGYIYDVTTGEKRVLPDSGVIREN